MTEIELDKWASWLLDRRDGGDPVQRAKAMEHLLPIRDRVLDGARITPGDVVLDVGAGDGLIGFAALDRVGESGSVVFSDISEDLLRVCQEIARELGVGDRVSFVEAAADALAPIEDASVDAVTTRSVLIYVEDKAAAFNEFHRVLRPGGRLSIFEPINSYFPDDHAEFWGFDTGAVSDLVEKIWAHEGWTEDAYPSDPMMNFDGRDLVRQAEGAGFTEVHLDLVVDVEPGAWVTGWDRLMKVSPNPNAHTVGESIARALTTEEAERFEAHLRPTVDAGRAVKRSASAFLWAMK